HPPRNPLGNSPLGRRLVRRPERTRMITLLRREFMVELPLEKAWQYLARVEQWPNWAKHIKQIELWPPDRRSSQSVSQNSHRRCECLEFCASRPVRLPLARALSLWRHLARFGLQRRSTFRPETHGRSDRRAQCQVKIALGMLDQSFR